MDQSTHEVLLSQWKEIIEQCRSRPEGMTAKQWLSEKEIPEEELLLLATKATQAYL